MVTYPQKKQFLLGDHHDRLDTSDDMKKMTCLTLKALEIGASPQKKAIFYFDRVFDDACTQEDVAISLFLY